MIKLKNEVIYELHKRTFERLLLKIGKLSLKYVRLGKLWFFEIRKGE